MEGNYWDVAQLVAQVTLNHKVAGSNPAVPAKIFHWEVAQLAAQVALNHKVEGSNPSFPANFFMVDIA